MSDCHAAPEPRRRGVALDESTPAVALLGSPNAGKTTLFNALTGGRAKTANYPGVTVTRRVGRAAVRDLHTGESRLIEVVDLPGTYSLTPMSPDEQAVLDELHESPPEALLLVADATSLERSLLLVGEALRLGLPTTLVLTMVDELDARGGSIDTERLSAALGIPVAPVVAHRRRGVDHVRHLLGDVEAWPRPVLPPSDDPDERAAWVDSVLASARRARPEGDRRTDAVDRVLLHPLWGTLTFFAVMIAFFQVIFTAAAPLQDLIGNGVGWLTDAAHRWFPGVVGDAIGDGAIGGVGTVLEFLPQIALLFLMISFLENVGYMSRAAFVVDRAMAKFGLEGRCFVSMLSSFACAVPGIMSTRSIPSSRDRIATIMAAPLMTCSARLPVFTLLIGVFVPNRTVLGPIRLPGLVLFGLYLLGALAGLAYAAILKVTALRSAAVPVYMEMPPYRMPTLRHVGIQVWDAVSYFLKKAGTIILATSLVMWLLLRVQVSPAAPTTDQVLRESRRMEHSVAGLLGRTIEPVFRPLGFDWRINVAVIGSLSAREVFVSTLAQTASAQDDDHLPDAMRSMTRADGTKVFTAPTIAAVLVFFVFALQCMSTIAVIRRETNSWRWPLIGFVSMSGAAWIFGWLAHVIVSAWSG